MAEVTIRELRHHGGDVVDRVERGERVTVTRDGRPVAVLSPVGPVPLSASALLRRWRRLPALDARSLRTDIDSVVDSRL
jgi:prevent-host-death family protein